MVSDKKIHRLLELIQLSKRNKLEKFFIVHHLPKLYIGFKVAKMPQMGYFWWIYWPGNCVAKKGVQKGPKCGVVIGLPHQTICQSADFFIYVMSPKTDCKVCWKKQLFWCEDRPCFQHSCIPVSSPPLFFFWGGGACQHPWSSNLFYM